MDEPLNGSQALGYLGLVRCAKFIVSIGLEFMRSFAEGMAQALAKLQLRFALCGIPIRKAFLAEIFDGGQHFLQFCDSKRDLFDRSSF